MDHDITQMNLRDYSYVWYGLHSYLDTESCAH